MKILAIDSSGLVATVAVMEEETMLAEYTVNYKKTHSQTLLPMLDEIVKMIELDMKAIDAIAVAGGPGSFTGLRIGSATAKGLGLALDKPLIAVPTVEGLAYNLYGTDKVICPLMDARRSQVYTGLYSSDTEFTVITDQKAVPVTDIIAEINGLGRAVIFNGDGVPVYKQQIEELIQVPYSFAPPHMSRQRAGAIGARAFAYARAGKIEAAREHKPEYLRKSQAEREREQSESACEV